MVTDAVLGDANRTSDICPRHLVLTFPPLVPPSNAGRSGVVGEDCLRTGSFIAGPSSAAARASE